MIYLIVVNSGKDSATFGFLPGLAAIFFLRQIPGQSPFARRRSGIQDNSFLVEEAYNQNFGVVQHISSFTRFFDSKDWVYTFTQEWPVPGDPRQQLSYTPLALHAGAFPDSGVGIGDVFLNYRYQLVGGGDTRVAFSPRLSLIFPSGDSTVGRGLGSFGLQTNLPLSVVLSKKLVSHWNAGATFFPHAQDASGDRAAVAGYNFGQSFIWLTHTRFNVMLETVFARSQTVVASDRHGMDKLALSQPRNPLGL